MKPVLAALDNLLQSMWFTSDPSLLAYAGNYCFEERMSRERQETYESMLDSSITTFDRWDYWHREKYLWKSIHQEVPETFTEANRDAAHSGTLSPEQYLVRVESLEHVLRKTGLALDEVAMTLQVFQARKEHAKYSVVEAADALAVFCKALNANPYSVRPRFAGFLQDVEDVLGKPDWPDQIRDRFGLAHYKPSSGESIPIALMRYRVGDVAALVDGRSDAKYPVCMPTVLDAQFSEFFVPAPRELSYGRTLDLSGDECCERKISEVLHLRFEYKPENIFMVGAISKGLDELERVGIRKFRENHLFCLQYDSGRNDFGVKPSHWKAT